MVLETPSDEMVRSRDTQRCIATDEHTNRRCDSAIEPGFFTCDLHTDELARFKMEVLSMPISRPILLSKLAELIEQLKDREADCDAALHFATLILQDAHPDQPEPLKISARRRAELMANTLTADSAK